MDGGSEGAEGVLRRAPDERRAFNELNAELRWDERDVAARDDGGGGLDSLRGFPISNPRQALPSSDVWVEELCA